MVATGEADIAPNIIKDATSQKLISLSNSETLYLRVDNGRTYERRPGWRRSTMPLMRGFYGNHSCWQHNSSDRYVTVYVGYNHDLKPYAFDPQKKDF